MEAPIKNLERSLIIAKEAVKGLTEVLDKLNNIDGAFSSRAQIIRLVKASILSETEWVNELDREIKRRKEELTNAK